MIRLADENIAPPVIQAQREAGYHVIALGERLPGILAEAVLEPANPMSAVLITADTDFGELVVRHKRVSLPLAQQGKKSNIMRGIGV
jgi:hypothetical protein